jgi:SAM-dependent methyltransferase
VRALREWQEQVAACREARLESEDEAWQREAEWYQDWVRHNDYLDLILPRLTTVLGPMARVLEIGPGSGAFTLPLARVVQEVVAVEPSADMRAVLGHRLAQAGIGNVRLIPQQVEEAVKTLAGSFDLAFASYSLYNVEEIDVVIRNLVHLARHVVALMGTGEPREWEQALYWRFLGREWVAPPQVQYLYPLLVEMGIHADVQVLWTSYNYVYDSEEALVEWWQRHFHLSESERPALREALWPLVERRDGQIGIYQRSHAALVWIERGRNV